MPVIDEINIILMSGHLFKNDEKVIKRNKIIHF